MTTAAQIAEQMSFELDLEFDAFQPRIAYAPAGVQDFERTSKEEKEAYASTSMADMPFHEQVRGLGQTPSLDYTPDSLPFRPGTNSTDSLNYRSRSVDPFPLPTLSRPSRSQDGSFTSSYILEERKKETQRLARLPTVRGKGGGKDFRQMRSKGWSLEKGWNSRPQSRGVETDVVQENIRRWAARQEYGRSKKKGFDQGASSRTDPSKWPQSANLPSPGKNEMIPLKEERISPGPRYDTSQKPPSKRYDSTWQRQSPINYSRAKDITFIREEPRWGRPMKTFSPGPIYSPIDVEKYRGTYKLNSAGRTHYGSIYYGPQNSASPGPGALNIREAYTKRSDSYPCDNVSMGSPYNAIQIEQEWEKNRPGSPPSPEQYLSRGQVKHILGPWEQRKNH